MKNLHFKYFTKKKYKNKYFFFIHILLFKNSLNFYTYFII